jgi:hypothetical protein
MPRVVSSRGVQFSVGGLHILLGVALALFVNHYVRIFPFWRVRGTTPIGCRCGWRA